MTWLKFSLPLWFLGFALSFGGCLLITDTDSLSFTEGGVTDTGTGASPSDTRGQGSDTAGSDTSPAQSDTGGDTDTATATKTADSDTLTASSSSDIPTTDTRSSTERPTETARPTETLSTELPTATEDRCEGWLDAEHNLCWEEPYDNTLRNQDDAKAYCEAKGNGWAMPTITQLRMLIRGCQANEFREEYRDGIDCIVDDTSEYSDWYLRSGECRGCEPGEGPSLGGCYWDATLSQDITCSTAETDTLEFWSTTGFQEDELDYYRAWIVDFNAGYVTVQISFPGSRLNVRCVRPMR